MNYQESLQEMEQKLHAISKHLINNPQTVIKFNTSDLPPHNSYNYDIRELKDPDLKFKDLNLIQTAPSIYWFECDTTNDAEFLRSNLMGQREYLKSRVDPRTTPPANSNHQSTCLYVGSRKGGFRQKDPLSNISGRLVQHLGYYAKGSTGGLQLLHWAKGLQINLSIKVAALQDTDNKWSTIIEKEMSGELRPLLGRH